MFLDHFKKVNNFKNDDPTSLKEKFNRRTDGRTPDKSWMNLQNDPFTIMYMPFFSKFTYVN